MNNDHQGDLFTPSIPRNQVKTLSPATLAYLGDAVFELFVRSQLLMPPRKIHDYHQDVVSHVKAESQAIFAKKVLPFLSEDELDVFRRARNSAVGKPKRVPLMIYQQATGIEALLGYLHLTNQTRLAEILHQFRNDDESILKG